MMICCYISLSLSLSLYVVSFYMYDMCSAAETIGKKFSFMRRFEVGERTEGNVTSSSPVVTAYGTTSVCVCVRGDPNGDDKVISQDQKANVSSPVIGQSAIAAAGLSHFA